MMPFFLKFSEILNQIFTPKTGHFGFFQLIKNYAKTILLIDKNIISLEASYAAQQNLRRVKFVFQQRFWVLYKKNHIY